MQPRCPSTDEWIKKLWYMYTMEYYSAIKRNIFESDLTRLTKLEPTIQNEVNQEEKNIIYWCLYMESRKIVLMNFRVAMENRYREQTYGHRGGEEGEGEIYGESNTETYNTICKIDSQWEFAVWHRELNRGSVTRRWDGEGDEREVWEGEDMVVPMGWFLWMHDRITKFCKVIILQLKKINEVAKNYI